MKLSDDLLSAIKKSPVPSLESVHLLFSHADCKPIPINSHFFHPLSAKDEALNLCFIDGGSAELIKTPTLSLSLLRFAALIYPPGQKKVCTRSECFLFTQAFSKENEIWYHAQVYGDDSPFSSHEFFFHSKDPRFCIAHTRASPSFAIDLLRKCGELALAKKMIMTYAPHAVILDMQLEMNSDTDQSFFSELCDTASSKFCSVLGVSKTTGLLTNTAESIASVLHARAPPGSWYYFPLAEPCVQRKIPELLFVKLHPTAKHIFRCEHMQCFSKNRAHEQMISALAYCSSDPQFLGYPYGLLQADRFARISNQEKSYVITQLQTKLGHDFPREGVQALSAHSVLDTVRF